MEEAAERGLTRLLDGGRWGSTMIEGLLRKGRRAFLSAKAHVLIALLPCLTMMSLALASLVTLEITSVWAGPPFVTDDPEPVEYRHGEFYIASQYAHHRDGLSMTAPHFECNLGLLSETQLHVIVPFAYQDPRAGSPQYGLGDTELGVKYRFIQEADWTPQAGVFPLLELPTGDSKRGLGESRIRVFLPFWLQKSWGPWKTYGGAGYWLHPGPGNENYWFLGWLLQCEIFKGLTVGAEVFHETISGKGGTAHTGFNVGTIVDLSEDHHFLFSAGRDFHGDDLLSFYVAYLSTFGAREEKGGKNLAKRTWRIHCE